MKKKCYSALILLSCFILASEAFGQQADFNYKSGFFNSFKGRLEGNSKESETPLLNTVTQKISARNNLWQQQIQLLKRQEDLNQMKNDLLQIRPAVLNNQSALIWVNGRIKLIETEFSQNGKWLLTYGQKLTSAQKELDAAESAYLVKVRTNAKVIGAIEYVYNQWFAQRTEPNWLGVVREVFKVSSERKILSTVNFSYSQPQITVVKVQPLQGGAIKQLQATNNSIPVGFYYFWLERNEQKVSQPKLFGIANPTHDIPLQ